MKSQIFRLFLISLIIVATTGSCEKNKTTNSDQNPALAKMLELKARMNALSTESGQMTNFMSVIGNSQYKDGSLGIGGVVIDSTYRDSINIDTANYWNYVTCAKVTELDNGDGTFTTIYDYGDGCNEYGTFFRGKVTYIWSNKENDYSSKVIYENFYNSGVEINGSSEYTFTSDGNSWFCESYDKLSDSTVVISPVFNWSGTSSGKEDVTYVYDSGEEYYVSSEFSNKWDSASFTVLTGRTDYLSKTGNTEYHYLVSEPLVTDYKCSDTWIPVSGIETVSSKENDQSYSYTINYGDGTCDNLATVTENGKTSVVDFSQIYKTVYGDSVVTNSGSSAPLRRFHK